MLTLPVPEMVHGTYAVATGVPPGDPMKAAHEQVVHRVPPPLRELTLDLLGSPLLTLDLRPAAQFPPLPADLLAAFGAAPQQVAEITAATHLLAVRSAYQPGWPPAHEWAARAVAGALGAALAAPVVDVFTPQVLAPDRLWRSLPDRNGRTRLVDWMLLTHTEGPEGFWFTSKGLGRFGLPELYAEGVPAELVEPCGELFNGLARKLLDLWLAELRAGQRSAFLELPETVTVGPADVAAAHDPQPARDEERRPHRDVPLRLRLDTTESQTLLTVLPAGPDTPSGSHGYAALCDHLFG